jgi:sugar O-acyltransferase (sialic acid O-acetyltransferase NeuD family)
MRERVALSGPLAVCWGATGQARVVHEALTHIGGRIAVLVDNRALPTAIEGVEIVQGEEGLRTWLNGRSAEGLRAIASMGGRQGADRLQVLDTMLRLGIVALDLVHPRAFVALDAQIGSGCQILAMAAVAAGARLGRAVIINTAASVDHDCVLGDGVHVAPGARLCGEVTIGDHVLVGAGAIVLPRLTIAADAVIGAGSVLTHDVPAGAVVYGNPARARARPDVL